jgi:hypothetical protein
MPRNFEFLVSSANMVVCRCRLLLSAAAVTPVNRMICACVLGDECIKRGSEPCATVKIMQQPGRTPSGLQSWLARGSSIRPQLSIFHPSGVRSHALTLTLMVHDIM